MPGNLHVRFGEGDAETCPGNGVKRRIPTLRAGPASRGAGVETAFDVLKPGLQIPCQKFSLVMAGDANQRREVVRVAERIRLLCRGRHLSGGLDGLCRVFCFDMGEVGFTV